MKFLWLCVAVAALGCAPAAAQAPGPDGLEQALRSALSRHPSVAGKSAELQAQGHAADAARAQRFPSLTLQAQGLEGRGNAGGQLPHSLRARQPVWSFGRIEDGIRLAEAGIDSERADLLRVQRQLLEQTAAAYAQVLGQRERLQIARDNSQAHQALHEQIQRRERGQLASRADVGLAATRLAQARSREQAQQAELAIARTELSALTQEENAAELPPAPVLAELAPAEQVLFQALSASADLRLRQAQIARAEAALLQTRSAAMPTIYLQAESARPAGGRTDQQLSLVFEASLDGMGLTTRSRSAQASAQLEAARQGLAAARSEVQRRLQRLLAQHRLQTELLDLQAESVAELAALLQSYKRQFEAGTKSWLDVLNIQRELFEQRLQQAQVRSERLTQALQVRAITGALDALAGLAATDAALNEE